MNLPEKEIYTDDRSVRIFNFFSGYSYSDRIKNFNTYRYISSERDYKNVFILNFDNIKDSYVVVNWKIINFLTSMRPDIKFPKEIYDPPENWILKKEIGKNPEEKVMIYYIQ